MIINLPYPPSINHYWRHTKSGRHYISDEGKTFRREVWAEARQQKANAKYTGRLSVVIKLWMPDKRKRDIDNVLKTLLDALQHADVYLDDCQIDKLSVERIGVDPPGRCGVGVFELPKAGVEL